MSDPVSSMDVEDVLSSIRRLVSEEAKGAGPQDDSQAVTTGVDIYEAAENAANEAFSDIIATGSINEKDTAGPAALDAPDNSTAGPAATETPEGNSENKMSFRHQPVAQIQRGEKQKLVLTAALRVTNPVSAPSAPTRPAQANRPHLHSIGGQLKNGIANSRTPNRGIHANPFDYAPEDTLFDRAKRAMDAVKSDRGRISTPDQTAGTNRSDIRAGDAPGSVMTPPKPDISAPDKNPGMELPENTTAKDISATAAQEGMAKPVSPTSPFSQPRDPAGPAAEEVPDDQNFSTDDTVSTINFAEEEESILDEETLRELVSEMVREELQGELGDRITRNVRKLVRREIQRALASREFE